MQTPTYHYRGKKTFIMLIVLRLFPAFFFLIGVIVLASVKGTIISSLPQNIELSETLESAANYIVGGSLIFFLLLCVILFVAAWLEYISFEYSIDDHAFKIRTGIFNITEMSLLYRQIQNVDISRPLIYRFLGMSRVVVITAGHEDVDQKVRDETEAVIDIIDKEQALAIQHDILSRANVQHVVAVPASTVSHMS